MQILQIKDSCLKKIEQIMFGYTWLGNRSDKERGIYRIKRDVLKNVYNALLLDSAISILDHFINVSILINLPQACTFTYR